MTMLGTILISGILSGAIGFGTIADNSFHTDDVYSLIRTPVNEVHWDDNIMKLDKLKLVSIIDHDSDYVWIVDYDNGSIVREDVLIKRHEDEIKAREVLTLSMQEEAKRRFNEALIDINASDSTMVEDYEGNLVYVKTGRPVFDNSTATVITVNFNISETTPLNDYVSEVQSNYEVTDNLSVVGYASPDGSNPKMQIELAFNRMKSVKEKLESLGYKITNSLGVVCSKDEEKSSCWKTEIKGDR